MPMPKDAKISRGYATIVGDPDALDFRAISEKMTADGHKMNHSSARNYLIRGLKKIASALSDHYGLPTDPTAIDDIVRSPEFHEGIKAVICERLCDGRTRRPI